MAFHTTDQMIAALTRDVVRQLTDDNDTGQVDTAVAESQATRAETVINGKLLARYTLPVSSGLDMLRELSIAITTYLLYRRRTAEVPDTVVADYKNALANLDNIVAGKIVLADADRTSTVLTNKTDDDRLFPDETLETY